MVDRKQQVREIVRRRYPKLTDSEIAELVELIWGEARREERMSQLRSVLP